MSYTEKYISVNGEWVAYTFYNQIDTPYPPVRDYVIQLKFSIQLGVHAAEVYLNPGKTKLKTEIESSRYNTDISFTIESKYVRAPISEIELIVKLKKVNLLNSLGRIYLISGFSQIEGITITNEKLFSSTLPPIINSQSYFSFEKFNIMNNEERLNVFQKKHPMLIELGTEIEYDIQQIVRLNIKKNNLSKLALKLRIPRSNHYQSVKYTITPDNYEINKDEDGNLWVNWNFNQIEKNTEIDFIVQSHINRKPEIFYAHDYGVIQDYSKNYSDLTDETDIWNTYRVNLPELKHILKSNDIYDIVTKVFEFVNQYLEYKISRGRRPAEETLKLKNGDCTEYADLMISLLRFMGIPARLAFGHAIERSNLSLTGHAWVEFMTPNEEYHSVDPTWGYLGGIPATHILEGYDEGNLINPIQNAVMFNYNYVKDDIKPEVSSIYRVYLEDVY